MPCYQYGRSLSTSSILQSSQFHQSTSCSLAPHNLPYSTKPLPLTGRPRALRPLRSLHRLPANNRILRHNIRPTHARPRPRIPPPLPPPQRPCPRHRFRLRLPNRRSSSPHRPPRPRRRYRSYPRSCRPRYFKYAEKRARTGMVEERASETRER